MPLMPVTIPMRIAAAVIAALLLASLGTAAWYVLPRWCPKLVIRNSPWVEPVLRARIHDPEPFGDLHSHDFEQRFQRWGIRVLPFLHRVLFTHSDENMRSVSMIAIDVMNRLGDHGEMSDWTVVRSTLVAMADPSNQVDDAASRMLSNWLERDGAVVVVREVFQSLTPPARAVLIGRLPEPPQKYMRNPDLKRCYVDYFTHPDPAAFIQAATRLRSMSMDTVFPDFSIFQESIDPEPPDTARAAREDILFRCLEDRSDISGITKWLARTERRPVMRIRLAYACAILRSPGAVPALIACLDCPDPAVCIHALQALRDIGDARALDAVIPLLSDPDESVRCMAVWTIGRLRHHHVPDLLKRALEDSDPLVVRAAERSLAEFIPLTSPAP